MTVSQEFLDALARDVYPADRATFDAIIQEWARWENTRAWHNPLSTTRPGPVPQEEPPSFVDHMWEWFNTFTDEQTGRVYHVRNYRDTESGAKATFETLLLPFYPDLLRWLTTGKLGERRWSIAQQIRTWGTAWFANKVENGWNPVKLEFKDTKVTAGSVTGCPVAGPITGHFDQQTGFWSPSNRHGGVDIAAPEGTPVCAPADGISMQFETPDFGTYVVIDHTDTPYYSAYAHLSAYATGSQGAVATGDIIGFVGSTGMATGPHLHWAVSTNQFFAKDFSQLKDPLSFLAEGTPVSNDATLEAKVEELEHDLSVLEAKHESLNDALLYDRFAIISLAGRVLDITTIPDLDVAQEIKDRIEDVLAEFGH